MSKPSSEESIDILLTKLISILEESFISLLRRLLMLFLDSFLIRYFCFDDFLDEAID
jgi:hypothetical protein